VTLWLTKLVIGIQILFTGIVDLAENADISFWGKWGTGKSLKSLWESEDWTKVC